MCSFDLGLYYPLLSYTSSALLLVARVTLGLWVLCFARSVSTAKVHKDLRDLGEQGPIWLPEGHPRWMERMSCGRFLRSLVASFEA